MPGGRAAARRRERGVAADDELALLVVHGVLHLLDYDHAETEEATVMRRREQELLDTVPRARREGVSVRWRAPPDTGTVPR